MNGEVSPNGWANRWHARVLTHADGFEDLFCQDDWDDCVVCRNETRIIQYGPSKGHYGWRRAAQQIDALLSNWTICHTPIKHGHHPPRPHPQTRCACFCLKKKNKILLINWLCFRYRTRNIHCVLAFYVGYVFVTTFCERWWTKYLFHYNYYGRQCLSNIIHARTDVDKHSPVARCHKQMGTWHNVNGTLLLFLLVYLPPRLHQAGRFIIVPNQPPAPTPCHYPRWYLHPPPSPSAPVVRALFCVYISVLYFISMVLLPRLVPYA